MKTNKKLLSIFIAIALIFSFVGCDDGGSGSKSISAVDEDDDSSDDSTPSPIDDPIVVVEPEDPEDPKVYFTLTFVNGSDSVDYTYEKDTVITLPNVTPIKGSASDGTEFNRVLGGWSDVAMTEYEPNAEVTITKNETYTTWYVWKSVGVETATGWIFYDKGFYTDGWRYIEVKKTDEPIGSNGKIRYWDSGVNFVLLNISSTNSSAFNIGGGKVCTDAIIDNSPVDLRWHAAGKTHLTSMGGNENWYLPSIMEWNEIRNVLILNGKGTWSVGDYWTGNEYDLDEAYVICPTVTPCAYVPKGKYSYNARVRAIRYF
jgi:hypothetical protein